MAPKRKPKNAFMLFTIHYKTSEEKKHNMLTLTEATTLAGSIWSEMTPQERSPWQEKAKADKIRMNYNSNEKFTSQGIPLSHIENERKELEARDRKMKKDICEMVQNSSIRNELETQSYYFIMVNYFIKSMDKNTFIPAEISLCEYSLKSGNIKKFHSLIDPGDGIYGHAYEAQQHSEETHRLPIPPHALGERDFNKLFNNVLKFIDPNCTGKYPPLFTIAEAIPVVESIMSFISCASEPADEEFRIYPLQFLFYTLKLETCAKGEHAPPNSIYITDAVLERDYYEYHSGLSCNFHEKIDKGKYCTLSYVIRWGFTFSDYMALDLAIDMIPGRHLPLGTDINKLATMNLQIDDDVSTVSEASGYDKPKLELKRYYYDEEGDSRGFDIAEDFPPLGQTKNKKSNQSITVPRVPSKDAFNLRSVGPGRGSFMHQSSQSGLSPVSNGVGRGRGQTRYDVTSLFRDTKR